MKKTSVLTAVFLFLFCNCLLVAQDEFDEDDEKYVLELALYGGLGIPSGGITDWQTGDFDGNPDDIVDRAPGNGWDMGMDLGYFVTQKLVLGINFNYDQFKIDTDEESAHSHRLFSPAIYGKYLFEGETNLVPYIKASIGMDWAKFSTFVENDEGGRRFREISYDPGLAFGFGLGLFYYTADYSGIYLEADYHTNMIDDKVASYKDIDYLLGENIGVIQLNFGVRLLISSGN
jgi:hypothetical protein